MLTKGGGGSEMRISARTLCIYVSVLKICRYGLSVLGYSCVHSAASMPWFSDEFWHLLVFCYCVLSSCYDASVLQFVTARDTLIILITLYDILRHITAFDAIYRLQVGASHYILFALIPSCLDAAKAKAKAILTTVVTAKAMEVAILQIVGTPMNGTILSRRTHTRILRALITLFVSIAAIHAITPTLAHVMWNTTKTMLSRTFILNHGSCLSVNVNTTFLPLVLVIT